MSRSVRDESAKTFAAARHDDSTNAGALGNAAFVRGPDPFDDHNDRAAPIVDAQVRGLAYMKKDGRRIVDYDSDNWTLLPAEDGHGEYVIDCADFSKITISVYPSLRLTNLDRWGGHHQHAPGVIMKRQRDGTVRVSISNGEQHNLTIHLNESIAGDGESSIPYYIWRET